MKVKTTNAEQIWQSPGGTRKIWQVTLKADDGSEYQLKTYSPKIAVNGFEGHVKSYLNDRGERFVRQMATATSVGAVSGSGWQPRDDAAIRAQWAIGQAISLASVKMDKDKITMPVIEKYARELFATVSRVKGEPEDAEFAAQGESHIKGFTQQAAF